MNPGDIHFHREPRPSVWMSALLLTVALHLLVILAVRITNPFAGHPLVPAGPDPIRMVFARPPAAETPSTFTELPPDRADERPDHPDFLSNVDSRARDDSPVRGESALPRMNGASDAPHVALVPGQTAQNPAAPSPETPEQPDRPDLAAEGLSRTPSPPRPQLPPALDPRLLLMRPGNSDITQEALLNPEGETPLYGGISLNTMAWDYAPWLQRFVRDFLRDWRAPYAYHMGLIDGWHVLELEIDPSGRLIRLDVGKKEGSDVLVQNSELTLRALAPYQPLPDPFPEKSLILRFKLTYSKAVRPAR